MKAELYVHDFDELARILARHGGIKKLTPETRKKVKEGLKKHLNTQHADEDRTDGDKLTTKQFEEMVTEIEKDYKERLKGIKKVLGE